MLDLSSSRSRGRAGQRRPRGAWLSALAIAGVLALGVPGESVAAVRAGGSPPTPATPAASGTYYSTTLSYVTRFYPRFFTWIIEALLQKVGVAPDTIVGQIRGPSGTIGPPVRTLAGPNVDTIYGACFDVDISQEPAILTVPPTKSRFSIVSEDVWFDNYSFVPSEPGTYALALPSWHGTLPPGVTRVNIPYPVTALYERADRYTNGVNTIASSKAFVAGLRLAPLPAYEADPSTGATKFLPQRVFVASTKVANDLAMRYTPTLYLQTLQTALHSPVTRPLTPSDVAVSKSFDTVFAAAQRALRRGNPVPLAQMVRAVHDAYAMVVSYFMTHTIDNSNWIYFGNAGEFGSDYLARDAVAEFASGINKPSSATYYFAYTDARGAGLNARMAYRLTFSKAQIPEAKRFWSVTAYTPTAVALIQWPGVRPIPPSAKNVASYTPGLVTNRNGSITIYIQPKPPANPSLYPNWLPTPASGPFLLWFRVYAPTGNTAPDKHYVPPPILPAG